MSYLLDTNVVSELRKATGSVAVKRWVATVDAAELFLSVLVVGEVRRGIELLRPRDPAQAGVYEAWLRALQRDYADRLLPITTAVAEEWGRLNAPSAVPTVDGLMAATARVHGLTLVTRNTSDLIRTGVALLDPFAG